MLGWVTGGIYLTPNGSSIRPLNPISYPLNSPPNPSHKLTRLPIAFPFPLPCPSLPLPSKPNTLPALLRHSSHSRNQSAKLSSGSAPRRPSRNPGCHGNDPPPQKGTLPDRQQSAVFAPGKLLLGEIRRGIQRKGLMGMTGRRKLMLTTMMKERKMEGDDGGCSCQGTRAERRDGSSG